MFVSRRPSNREIQSPQQPSPSPGAITCHDVPKKMAGYQRTQLWQGLSWLRAWCSWRGKKNHLIDPEKCFEQFREAGCFIAYGHATAMNLPEFLQFSPQWWFDLVLDFKAHTCPDTTNNMRLSPAQPHDATLFSALSLSYREVSPWIGTKRQEVVRCHKASSWHWWHIFG